MERFAMFFATMKHSNQLYSGMFPYTHHLMDVRTQGIYWADFYIKKCHTAMETESCHDFGVSCSMEGIRDELLTAILLHDTIEDTEVSRKELEEMFSPLVGELVWRVSNEPGKNRAERHTLTYPKLKENPLAVFIKLCDRIANIKQGGSLVGMYSKEHEAFKAALQGPDWVEMWTHLDNLIAQWRY